MRRPCTRIAPVLRGFGGGGLAATVRAVPPKKRKPRRPRGPTSNRSIRFSDDEWADIERKATRWGLTASAAIRQAALAWARAPERQG